MKIFLVLIIFSSTEVWATSKFVCSKARSSFEETVTYKVKTPKSCNKLCGLAYERSAGLACGRQGIDIKIQVLDDGLKSCGTAEAQNTSCTIKVKCDVCPR